MVLLQIFLPLYDPERERFPRESYEQVERELVTRFGGFTAYARSPASGLWKDDHSRIQSDDLVIYEVMTDDLDRTWWQKFRRILEKDFRQDQVLIRSHAIEVID